MFPDGQPSYLRALFVVGIVLAMLCTAASTGPSSPSQPASPAQKAPVVETYGRLPLSFEENTGQSDKSVKFLSRGRGYGLYLTGNGAEWTLCQAAPGANQPDFQRDPVAIPKSAGCEIVRMQLMGASLKTEPAGEEGLPGTVSYFMGSDPARWRTGIPTYAKVRYPDVYPGIDLVYSGSRRQLEFDFVVAPHADPRAIRLRFSGPDRVHLAANGDVVVTAANGTLAFHKPLVYQVVHGQRHPVAGGFRLLGKHTAGFQLGPYDRAKAVVIDPVLTFSTFLGGSNMGFWDQASAVAVDSSGTVYVAGRTSAANFPVTSGSFQTTNRTPESQGINAFITKLNPTGTALVYSTYLGGSAGDAAYGLAVDSSGNAYVTGSTYSTDFPTTQGAFQTTNKAAANSDATAFVTVLNATGTALVYSTYLGGSGLSSGLPDSGDKGSAIAVDAVGNAYVTGSTYSTDFPLSQGAFQTTNKGAAKSNGNAFITKLNPAGTALLYSTYLGGSGAQKTVLSGDTGIAISLDASGEAYVAGRTFSSDFPTTAGAFQTTNNALANQGTNAFVTKLNSTGSALVYSTYLGGSSSDSGNAIAVDPAGEAYVAGGASSTNFPATQGAFQTKDGAAASGLPNAFITKLNPAGAALVYSTYLGGSGGVVYVTPTLLQNGGDQANGLAIDGSGNVYVTGSTASSNFPVTQDAYQTTNNDQPGCAGSCAGGYNAFITELNSSGTALIYSTYLGGNGINPYDSVGVIEFGEGDQANALALDSSGNVYVAGSACSFDFPLTSGAFQTTIPSQQSPFAAKLNMSEPSTASRPTVTVTPGSSGITSGLPLRVTISVAGPSGAATPTGTVTLASGTYFSSPTTLSSGGATIDIPGGSLLAEPAAACGVPPAPDNLSVDYLPDAASSPTYKSSSGLAPVIVVGPCVSTSPDLTTVTLAQAQSQPFLLGIAATGGTGNPVPTGTVTVATGSYISAATTLSGGDANISIPANTFTVGNNSVNVSYSGDSNYAAYPNAGGALVIVTNTSGIGFAVTGAPVTIQGGATTGNTSTVTVTEAGGFIGEVTLTAVLSSGPSGAQDPPSFSFGASSPVLIGPAHPSSTATLAITTTAATGCSQAEQAHRGVLWYAVPWYAGGGAVLACALFLGGLPRRRNRRYALGVLVVLILASGLLACSGSGGSSCNGGATGTTPGTYTITVTGTSGPTTATGTVTLSVQ